jgi:hypothetical protein
MVDALNSSGHKLSEVGVLLREARSMCIALFDFFCFKHYCRSCNKIAHTLADFGSQTDVSVAPYFVSELVANESDVSVE